MRKTHNNIPPIFYLGLASLVVSGVGAFLRYQKSDNIPEQLIPTPYCSYPGKDFENSFLYHALVAEYGDEIAISPEGRLCVNGVEIMCGPIPEGIPQGTVEEITNDLGFKSIIDPQGRFYCIEPDSSEMGSENNKS